MYSHGGAAARALQNLADFAWACGCAKRRAAFRYGTHGRAPLADLAGLVDLVRHPAVLVVNQAGGLVFAVGEREQGQRLHEGRLNHPDTVDVEKEADSKNHHLRHDWVRVWVLPPVTLAPESQRIRNDYAGQVDCQHEEQEQDLGPGRSIWHQPQADRQDRLKDQVPPFHYIDDVGPGNQLFVYPRPGCRIHPRRFRHVAWRTLQHLLGSRTCQGALLDFRRLQRQNSRLPDENSQRIDKLESHLAHLEHQVEQLNEVVIEQGKLLDRLKKETHRQSAIMQTLELERIKSNVQKPPHYQ